MLHKPKVSLSQLAMDDVRKLHCAAGHSNLLGVAGVSSVHRVTCDPLHPFNHPKEGPRARAFTPDNMEPEEIEAFPEYFK